MPFTEPRRQRLGLIGRAAAIAAALLLAVVAAARQHSLAARQDKMAAWLTGEGVPVPRALEHDPDTGSVELRAARAALASELDPAHRTDLAAGATAAQEPGEGLGRAAAGGSDRLAYTAELAQKSLANRPTDSDAAMVLGTATYLAWSRGHDTRLFTQARAWEAPLTAAISLAPGRSEAARLLAAAYLELWPELSAAKRAREKLLLAGVFADPPTFAAMLGPWLTAAGSREEAFSVVPHQPEAWQTLAQFYTQRFDWPGYCAARERWDLALRDNLTRRLAEAEGRPGAPDSRDRFLAVAAEARPGRAYLPLLTRALDSCPAGTVDHHTAERLGRLLSWNLERCRLAGCPLGPRPLTRLAGFCRDLDPRQDAMAALATGDLGRAYVLERTYATAFSDDWAPYFALKARTLLEQGGRSAAEAEEPLAALPQAWRDRPSTWQVRAAIARAAADPAAENEAARELARLTARAWPAEAWDTAGAVARLEILTDGAAAGLTAAIDLAPPRGAAVEVRLDDAILGTFPVTTGQPLAIRTPLAAGLHLLEIEDVAGGAVRPGAVALLAALSQAGAGGS